MSSPRRAVLVALAVVLLVGSGSASALTTIGERAVVDIHGKGDKVPQVLGLTAAADGRAFVADSSGILKVDNCRKRYVPVRVRSVKPDGTQPAFRTLPLPSSVANNGFPVRIPVALARTATRPVLLVGVDGSIDTNSSGRCSPPADPVVLLELDPNTLQTLASFTAAQLGRLASVRRLSVVPVASGPTPVIVVGVRDMRATMTPATLARFNAIPDAPATLAPAWTQRVDNGLTPTDYRCFFTAYNGDPVIAAMLDGRVLLSTHCAPKTIWAVGADGSAPVAWRSSNDELPFVNESDPPVATAPDGTVLVDHRAPAFDRNGFVVNYRAGVARFTADGQLRDAFGLRDMADPYPASHAPCTFTGGYPGREPSPLVAAAGNDTVVTASDTATNDYYGPTWGPRLRWFGDGPLQPDCLVRPQPLARLKATPAQTTPGQPVIIDASASAALHYGSERDNRLVSIAWRIGEGEFSAPASPSEPRRTVSFAQPGTYPIDIRVTDAYGQVGIGRLDLFVAAPDPVAKLSAPTTPKVGELVTLDASASTGPPVRYEFDLDGSGRFATDAASRSSIQHVFTQTGPINVGLRVTNNAGVSATTTLLIDVQRPGDPPPPERAQDGYLTPSLGGTQPLVAAAAAPVALLEPATAVRDGAVRVRLVCLADGGDCAGHLALERRTRVRGHMRDVAASARTAVMVAAGRTLAVDVPLGAWAQSALRRHRRLTLDAVATLAGPSGTVVVRRTAPLHVVGLKGPAR